MFDVLDLGPGVGYVFTTTLLLGHGMCIPSDECRKDETRHIVLKVWGAVGSSGLCVHGCWGNSPTCMLGKFPNTFLQLPLVTFTGFVLEDFPNI